MGRVFRRTERFQLRRARISSKTGRESGRRLDREHWELNPVGLRSPDYRFVLLTDFSGLAAARLMREIGHPDLGHLNWWLSKVRNVSSGFPGNAYQKRSSGEADRPRVG
jgi:hypothetical protein